MTVQDQNRTSVQEEMPPSPENITGGEHTAVATGKPVSARNVHRSRSVMLWGILGAIVCGMLGSAAYWGPGRWRAHRESGFRAACEQARKDRDWRAEEMAAREWLAWNPSATDAWLYLAEAAVELEYFDQAREALLQVPADDSRYTACLLERARLEASELNLPVEALATYQELIERRPTVVESHSFTIAHYAFSSQRIPLLRAIRRSIELQAEPLDAYAYLILADKLTITNAREIAMHWLSSDPASPRFRINLAIQTALAVAMTVDRDATTDSLELERESIFRLEEFLQMYPDDLVLIEFLLAHYTEAGEVEQVERLLTLVPETGGEDHMIWKHRAWYHVQLGEYAQARQALTRALELHPMSPAVRHDLAAVMRILQEPPEEIETMQRLAFEGREIRRQVLQMPTTNAFTREQLDRIRIYAEECGDTLVAAALTQGLYGGSTTLPSPTPPQAGIVQP